MRTLGALSLLTALVAATPIARPPATPKRPVVDVFHGISVRDDYRWLENWNDPAVKKWSDTENDYARQYLDHLPNVTALRGRVTKIMEAKTISYGSVRMPQGAAVRGGSTSRPSSSPC